MDDEPQADAADERFSLDPGERLAARRVVSILADVRPDRRAVVLRVLAWLDGPEASVHEAMDAIGE